MNKILTVINQFFAEISGWFLSVITFLLVLNLLTRTFGIAVQGLLELTTFVFLAVIYLGLAHCEEHDEHIKVNVILQRVPESLRVIFNVFNYILATVVGAILTYAAVLSAINAYVSKEAVPGTAPLPTFPVRFVIFLGLGFFTLQALLHLFKYIKHLKG